MFKINDRVQLVEDLSDEKSSKGKIPKGARGVINSISEDNSYFVSFEKLNELRLVHESCLNFLDN